MLLFSKAKKIVVENEVLGKYNMLEIPLEINELGININLYLSKASIDDPLSTWNTELIKNCAEYISNKQVILKAWEFEEPLDKFALAKIVSDLSISSFDCGKDVFKYEVVTPDWRVKNFKKTNKEELKEIETLLKAKHSLKNTEKKETTLDDILHAIKNIKVEVISNHPSVQTGNTNMQATQSSAPTSWRPKPKKENYMWKRVDLWFLNPR